MTDANYVSYGDKCRYLAHRGAHRKKERRHREDREWGEAGAYTRAAQRGGELSYTPAAQSGESRIAARPITLAAGIMICHDVGTLAA